MAKLITTNDFENEQRIIVFNSNVISLENLQSAFNNKIVEGDTAFDYHEGKEYMYGDDASFHEITEGGSATLITKSITANGTYTALDDNADGYSVVTVNVPNPSTGAINITENGTYDVTEKASAVVDVPNPSTGAINITENGTYDVTEKASAVVEIPIPPVEVESGVNFIDYDGTLIESWNSEDVASKTALPSNPSHSGLVAQGWNWTLADIQSYISSYPNIIITVGQMYATVSELTEIDIELSAETGLTATCTINGAKDWGDGNSDSNTSHTYTNYGNYTIKSEGVALTKIFGQTSSSHNYYAKAVRLSNNIRSIVYESLAFCESLEYITLPSSLKTYNINAYAFDQCHLLKSITLPIDITTLDNSTFRQCYNIKYLSLPIGVYSIGDNLFEACRTLQSIILLNTNITALKSDMLNGCDIRKYIATPSISSIQTRCFNNCYKIKEYDFTRVIAVPTLSNINAFYNINKLTKIKVPLTLEATWKTATNWATYADYIEGVE